jgi:hypothetical protein
LEAITVNRSMRPVGATIALAGLLMLSACSANTAPTPPTVGAASSPAAATAVTAASPAAATVVAGASPAAATVVTGASPAAATVVAGASPAAATVVTGASPAAATVAVAASPAAATVVTAASPAAATLSAASPVRISAVQVSLADVTITLQNASSSAVDLANWRLRAGTATATLPSGARVPPNDSITIHSASGASSDRDIYLGQDALSLVPELRPGASVSLLDAQGNVVTDFRLPG